mgnify:CR=1 FL=1
MKLALISDIHANYPALKASLDVLDDKKIDQWLCLGDLVGYGPFPEQCIEEIRTRKIPCLLGNHDASMVGKMPFEVFKEPNRSLLMQTRELLDQDSINFFQKMPLTLDSETINNNAELKSDEDENEDKDKGRQHLGNKPIQWLAAHASPIEPYRWNYLDSAIKCRKVLKEFPKYDALFVGHTHRPAFLPEKIGTFGMKKGQRYMFNPGSIGQPRDNDERSSVMVIDFHNYEYENIRIEYDVDETLKGYKRFGISQKKGRRLLKLKKKSSFWWF